MINPTKTMLLNNIFMSSSVPELFLWGKMADFFMCMLVILDSLFSFLSSTTILGCRTVQGLDKFMRCCNYFAIIIITILIIIITKSSSSFLYHAARGSLWIDQNSRSTKYNPSEKMGPFHSTHDCNSSSLRGKKH